MFAFTRMDTCSSYGLAFFCPQALRWHHGPNGQEGLIHWYWSSENHKGGTDSIAKALWEGPRQGATWKLPAWWGLGMRR